MRTADLTTALVLMAGGLLVIWDSLRLGIGWGTDGPQSGFFPFWLAMFLLAASGVIAGQAWRRGDGKPFVTRAQLRPVLSTLLPAAGFVVLVQWLGLYVASAVFLGFYMRWIGRYGWIPVILLGVLFPVITFVVFEQWFLVPMPKGPLEAWLGY
ncbi:MAG TPA: tripartite tricarboxylate transporter TctB family protein [Methylomirabilota bacterium]|nr:tripartite tricarboxylate transporter TctB family protein [Methylomirabilota bacterium]